MALCHDCRACFKSCPSGAIPKDRFLIKAELCLTFHNEREGSFPEWIKPEWHHCLVGCLHCQSVCWANKHVFNWEETREHFSEKETSMILNGLGEDELPTSTLDKLEKLSLTEYLKLLPRNLEAVLRNQKKAG
jgi:epoxyqueuosine reductase